MANSSETSKDLFTVDKTANTIVKEGSSEVVFPNSQDVFYNPVQEFNRDISIAVIKEYMKVYIKSNTVTSVNDKVQVEHAHKDNFTIVECLAASGLRSIRYAKEIPGVKKIIANDLADEAFESITANVKLNNVEDIVIPNHGDAAMLLYENRSYNKRFDVVDLDPYGSPTAFLDSAVQAVKDNGLLMITCTDLAILCGNHSETCRAKYGATSIKSKACHEIALRIVLQAVESHANRYGRYITPLLSVSVDFYVRVFLIIKTSQKMVKCSSSKLSMVYRCTGCDTFSFQPLGKFVETKENNIKHSVSQGPPVNINCEHCGHRHVLGGPVWTAPIHDQSFVQNLCKSVQKQPKLFGTSKRMIGILSVLSEELADSPLYYHVDRLCQIFSVKPMKRKDLWSAILNAGYKVSSSHAAKSTMKTNAPPHFIWDIMKEWRKKVSKDMNLKELAPSSPGFNIMSQPSKSSVSFEAHENSTPESMQNDLVRYQVNPQANWGPKARAKSSIKYDTLAEKRKLLQGKKRKQPDENTNRTDLHATDVDNT